MLDVPRHVVSVRLSKGGADLTCLAKIKSICSSELQLQDCGVQRLG